MTTVDTPRQGPVQEQGYKLVKQASDQYRRAGAKLERARKALREAERNYDLARRDLKLSIDAIQPSLPIPTEQPDLHGWAEP